TRAICSETEGSPFFIEEVLRHLAESGAVYRRGGEWTADLSSGELPVIPEGVKDVIGRRLGRLSDDANRVLSVASAIGREFGLEVLEALEVASAEPLLEALEEAVRARVLVEQPGAPGRYGFSHALIREAL